METPVGFRFRPTDEEIVDYYLRLKNLGDGSTSDVDGVITTVNICSFDPWDLPSQSRTGSKDQVWYFFGRNEKKYNRGERQIRKTKSGFWKKTGVTMEIKGKKGKKGNREKIGEKRVLVFHLSKQLKTKWVMHEYHTTFLTPNQMMRYTICKVAFKGEAREMCSSSASEVEHGLSLIAHINNSAGSKGLPLKSQELQSPLHLASFLDMEALNMAFDNALSDEWNNFFDDDDEQRRIVSKQEDRNEYKPQKSLTGVFIGHSSDGKDCYLFRILFCAFESTGISSKKFKRERKIF